MFGTSGIRGIYGKEITEELAFRIASIFAQKKLVVGRDIRASGPALFEAVCDGAFSSGTDVIDLGIVPTPTVALATKKHSCRGIMLTASHNPPEYNGLKLIENGKEIGKALEKEITERYKQLETKKTQLEKTGHKPARDPGQTGYGALSHDNAIIDDHKALVFGLVDRESIKKKKPKVIVDCNGAASVITPSLLTDLGCSVISLNASLDCFNRPSEPRAENLPYLGAFVRECKADFAIAHDGDGDRCVVFDEHGEMLPLDVQLAIMIEHELFCSKRKNTQTNRKKIISTVEASLTIRDVVEKNGGEIGITPVGSTFVGDELERTGALFGGEPCGEYIYEKGVHVPDAVLAAAKFAEIFSLKGPFSKLKAKYPQNFIWREKFHCKDKQGAVERIRKKIDIQGKIRSDDGIRIDERDGWFLIRASGTEPIVRLTMEYKTKDRLEERKAGIRKIIAESL